MVGADWDQLEGGDERDVFCQGCLNQTFDFTLDWDAQLKFSP